MESLLRDCQFYGVDLRLVAKSTPCSEEDAYRLRIERLLCLKKLEFCEVTQRIKDAEIVRLQTELTEIRRKLMQVEIQLEFCKRNSGVGNGGAGVVQKDNWGNERAVIGNAVGSNNGGRIHVEQLVQSPVRFRISSVATSTMDLIPQAENPFVRTVRTPARETPGTLQEVYGRRQEQVDPLSNNGNSILATRETLPIQLSTFTEAFPSNNENPPTNTTGLLPMFSCGKSISASTSGAENKENEEYDKDPLRREESNDTCVKVECSEDDLVNRPYNEYLEQVWAGNRMLQNSNREMDLKPFGCPRCPKRFSIQSSLKRHHLRAHDGVVFKCRFCPKTFLYSDRLKDHERQHVNGTPELTLVPCKFCKKTFPSFGGLRLHLKYKHPNESLKLEPRSESRRPLANTNNNVTVCSEERKTFPCPLCGKAFFAMANLYQHKRVVHKCRFCRELFPNSGERNKHEKIHTAVRNSDAALLNLESHHA